MIDLKGETLLGFAAAGRYLSSGRGGRPATPSTFYRWSRRGLRGVKLEVIRIGGRVYTSVEALQRFADALTAAVAQAPTPRPPQAGHRAADAELGRLGF